MQPGDYCPLNPGLHTNKGVQTALEFLGSPKQAPDLQTNSNLAGRRQILLTVNSHTSTPFPPLPAAQDTEAVHSPAVLFTNIVTSENLLTFHNPGAAHNHPSLPPAASITFKLRDI